MLQAKEVKFEVRQEAFHSMAGMTFRRSVRQEAQPKRRLGGRKSKGVWWEGQAPGVSEQTVEHDPA